MAQDHADYILYIPSVDRRIDATLELDDGDEVITVTGDSRYWEAGFKYTIGLPAATAFEFAWSGPEPHPTVTIVPSAPQTMKTVAGNRVTVGPQEERIGIVFGDVPEPPQESGSQSGSENQDEREWIGTLTIKQA